MSIGILKDGEIETVAGGGEVEWENVIGKPSFPIKWDDLDKTGMTVDWSQITSKPEVGTKIKLVTKKVLPVSGYSGYGMISKSEFADDEVPIGVLPELNEAAHMITLAGVLPTTDPMYILHSVLMTNQVPITTSPGIMTFAQPICIGYGYFTSGGRDVTFIVACGVTS